MAQNTTWDHQLTYYLFRLMLCNRLLQVHGNNPSGFLFPITRANDCVWKSINTDLYHVNIGLQRLSTNNGKNGHFPLWTSWTCTVNLLAYSIEVICWSIAKSIIFSLEQGHLTLLEADFWFIYALTSQKKLNIIKCLSDKTKLHCFLTQKHYWLLHQTGCINSQRNLVCKRECLLSNHSAASRWRAWKSGKVHTYSFAIQILETHMNTWF